MGPIVENPDVWKLIANSHKTQMFTLTMNISTAMFYVIVNK